MRGQCGDAGILDADRIEDYRYIHLSGCHRAASGYEQGANEDNLRLEGAGAEQAGHG